MAMAGEIFGRYRIIREIGRSNDIVYEALDEKINRRVALKELLLAPTVTGVQRRERIDRFYREARAAGTLSHPGIVTIYEAGEDNGRHFIAMEFLEGQPLRRILEMEGHLSVERAVDITMQVCSALSYAHSKGVIHRDIKPDNIQILPSGQVKLTDFGIARIIEEPSITADGQVFGTPSYMSPEQVAGKPLDSRTDLFSLGVVLYEMVVGRKPFVGDTVVTITYNIMNQDVSVPPTVPAFIERTIRRGMAKDAAFRYASASEMASDLDPTAAPIFQPEPSSWSPGSVTTPSQDPGMPVLDPFSVTVGQPAQTSAPFPPAAPPPDPFAGLRPGDMSFPRVHRPLLSADAAYFLKVLFVVLVVAALVVAFVWVVLSSYQNYEETGKRDAASRSMSQGVQYLREQSYMAAVEQFNVVLSTTGDPRTVKAAKHNIATAYIELGIAAEKAGNYPVARTYYQQALDTDPSYGEASLYLGNLMRRQNQTDEAVSAWEKAGAGGSAAAVESRRQAALEYINRGDEALRRGDNDGAADWWKKAVGASPGTDAGRMAQERIQGLVQSGRSAQD